MVINMAARRTLPQWKRPRRDVLREEKYKRGEPPFYPFPTVSNVVRAAFCPLAILHDLLHGSSGFVEGGRRGGTGELFHKFIAHLKTLIAMGRCSAYDANQEFIRFARGYSGDVRRDCWRYYLEDWFDNKMEELDEIEEGASLLFEPTVANTYTPFEYEDGERTYPLRGKIDEIDLENHRLIERTIREGNDGSPPEGKDYQLWLLWKALCTIQEPKYPDRLRGVNFEDFDLVIETPQEDFHVSKSNPGFEEDTNRAYAWIRDLAFDPFSIGEAYRGRSCNLRNQIEECEYRPYCFSKNYDHPKCRTEMRRNLRDMFRPLLWEQIWVHHLRQYQLTMLEQSVLEERGIISTGRIESNEDGRVELTINRDQARSIEAYHRSGTSSNYQIIIGTFHLGQRLEGFFEDRNGERLILRTRRGRFQTLGDTAMIQSSDSSAPIMETKPWFLSRNLQRDLFWFGKIGREREDVAERDSIVQFIEGLFGSKNLRKEGS